MFLAETCSICRGTYKKPCAIVCKHVFCFSCIRKWYFTTSFYTHNNIKVAPCPICRKYFYEKDIMPYKIETKPTNLRWQSQYLYTNNPKIPSISHVPSRTRNQTHQKRWEETMKYLHDICFNFNNVPGGDDMPRAKVLLFLKHINNNNWFIQKNGWGPGTENENQRKAFIKLLTTKLHEWREEGVIYSNYFIYKYRKYLYKNN